MKHLEANLDFNRLRYWDVVMDNKIALMGEKIAQAAKTRVARR